MPVGQAPAGGAAAVWCTLTCHLEVTAASTASWCSPQHPTLHWQDSHACSKHGGVVWSHKGCTVVGCAQHTRTYAHTHACHTLMVAVSDINRESTESVWHESQWSFPQNQTSKTVCWTCLQVNCALKAAAPLRLTPYSLQIRQCAVPWPLHRDLDHP